MGSYDHGRMVVGQVEIWREVAGCRRKLRDGANMASISMEEKIMRKAIPCLLLLCSVIAFGQEPQWTVIKHVTVMQQTQSVAGALLTPTEPGIYRLNLYFSGSGGGKGDQSYFIAHIHAIDTTGVPVDGGQTLYCNAAAAYWMPPIMVSLKPQQALSYYVIASPISTAGCQYNLAITVEQLVQQ